MASLLLRRPILSPFALTSTLCITSMIAYPIVTSPFRQKLRLDGPMLSNSRSFSDYKNNAQTPVVKKDGRFNAKALRQVSTGSILGLVGGLAVSVFSKPLAVLIGLLIFGAQALESRGLHLIPTQRIQGYFKGINVQSAIQDNVAFKLSFGITFALAGFGSF
ncbi:hypothetical protein E2P81_ATG06665 [Venturia nashicola]|uniref:Uncharacterized protein n=1 Tax=Venturia nashicola TaxID=86259 RepID=A0A4Z1PAQ8_9PEZI|nr:hypothetical protein E6O75_ATG06835 [Venturia nashicola]TLD30012.1 hypothetical protein E2P81_ATG06665 [Venturia nashicola]